MFKCIKLSKIKFTEKYTPTNDRYTPNNNFITVFWGTTLNSLLICQSLENSRVL